MKLDVLSKALLVIDPYVFWRHPIARLLAVALLLVLNVFVYGTDPLNDSRVELNMPLIGNAYGFLFNLPYSGDLVFARVGLIFLASVFGLYLGRQGIHHYLFRDKCGLSMCGGSKGSFFLIFFGIFATYVLGGVLYNFICRGRCNTAMASTGVEARTFGKMLQCVAIAAQTTGAVQVVDEVLQDRQRYPDWAPHSKLSWRRSCSGCLRIIFSWVLFSMLVFFLCLCSFIPSGTWGSSHEISRVFLEGCVLFLQVFIVVQDWEFPTFSPNPKLDIPLLVAGTSAPILSYNLGSCLSGCMGLETSDPLSSKRQKLIALRDFLNISISRQWLAYGPLILAVCLNLLGPRWQIPYAPKDYGQYVDPNTNQIWTIVDTDYLKRAYDEGVLTNPELVAWGARHDATTGLALDSSAASDIMTSAYYLGSATFWKFFVAAPGLLFLVGFLPLALLADFLASKSKGRPPLISVPPEPEQSTTCRDFEDEITEQNVSFQTSDESKLGTTSPTIPTEQKMVDLESQKLTTVSVDSISELQPNGLTPQILILDGERNAVVPLQLSTLEPSSLNSGDEPKLLDSSQMTQTLPNALNRHDEGAPRKIGDPSTLVSSDLDGIRNMSSCELITKAREHALLLGGESAIGHFDALFRKDGKALGLSFKLSDRKSRKGDVAHVRESLAQAGASRASLNTPDPDEELRFGKFVGWKMRAVADMHTSYCVWVLQQERNSKDISPDVLRFVLYLRTSRPDIEDREEKWLQASQTLLVIDVVPGGCIDSYNRIQASEGNWDRVVVPGMQISSVNGISQDPVAMGSALCNSEVSTVRFEHLLSVDGQATEPMSDPMAEKMQSLLQERASKLINMEQVSFVEGGKTPDDWEAITTKLAQALVKEVQQGERCLTSALIPQTAYSAVIRPPGVPSPVTSARLSQISTPTLPPGFPPTLHIFPPGVLPTRLGYGDGCPSISDLSDSGESV